MSSTVTEQVNGKLIEVNLSGKLTADDYDKFVPLTEERIKQYGSIRLLVILNDFHGWDAGALWDDIKFDVKHFKDIERLAIVGESKWEKGMAVFCRPFTSAEIKYFDHSEVESARQWIQSEGE